MIVSGRVFILSFSLACLANFAQGDVPSPSAQGTALKSLSLEELSQIEVISPGKTPQNAFKTPSAIYVITGEEIRRSGATSIPRALRLAPGVEVARIDGNKWSIGIRGFGGRLSRAVLRVTLVAACGGKGYYAVLRSATDDSSAYALEKFVGSLRASSPDESPACAELQ